MSNQQIEHQPTLLISRSSKVTLPALKADDTNIHSSPIPPYQQFIDELNKQKTPIPDSDGIEVEEHLREEKTTAPESQSDNTSIQNDDTKEKQEENYQNEAENDQSDEEEVLQALQDDCYHSANDFQPDQLGKPFGDPFLSNIIKVP